MLPLPPHPSDGPPRVDLNRAVPPLPAMHTLMEPRVCAKTYVRTSRNMKEPSRTSKQNRSVGRWFASDDQRATTCRIQGERGRTALRTPRTLTTSAAAQVCKPLRQVATSTRRILQRCDRSVLHRNGHSDHPRGRMEAGSRRLTTCTEQLTICSAIRLGICVTEMTINQDCGPTGSSSACKDSSSRELENY